MTNYSGFAELTTEAAQQLCEQWQKALRLSDWDIRVRVLPMSELMQKDCWGYVAWNSEHKTANIELMCVQDVLKNRYLDRPYNIEETLVHELLHLHLAEWETHSEQEQDAQEFAINAIARALCKLTNREQEKAANGSEAGRVASKKAKKSLAH